MPIDTHRLIRESGKVRGTSEWWRRQGFGNRWQYGQTVRVGFLSYRVAGFRPTPGDGRPDQYLLDRNGKLYIFTPHYGIEHLTEPADSFRFAPPLEEEFESIT